MSLQFIHDNKGNTTGVFIPIEDWQSLKDSYGDLQIKEIETLTELPSWQKQLIDERLNDYYQNPADLVDFDTTLDNIEKSL